MNERLLTRSLSENASFTDDLAGQMLMATDPDIVQTFYYDALGCTTRTRNNLLSLDTDVWVEQVFDQLGNRAEMNYRCAAPVYNMA